MLIDIQEKLALLVRQALAAPALGLGEADRQGAVVEFSLSSGFGDIATNAALRLARQLKKPPIEIAGCIAAEMTALLPASGIADLVSQIKAEGAGFVNIYLTERYFRMVLKECLDAPQRFGSSALGAGKKVLVEFVSANPTGPLSVAHARQAAVGDALANILRHIGFAVDKEYYLNDEGNQINILGDSVRLRLNELEGQKIEYPENYYQGDYIIDMARQIKQHNLRVDDFPAYSGQVILDVIKQELEDFQVHFDCWYSQKELRTSGKIEETLACLKEKGFLYEQDGALWFRSTDFGDDKDRVVIKSDKAYTYLAPDIAYHREKFKRGYQWLINLWGPDHHGYISRLKASVQALGGKPDSLSVVIVQLATIFRDGKVIEMSTRKGQYITLREVLDEVGCDAARFFFLMRKTSSHLNFDLETAKKQTNENPVYYVQYAHARIASILRANTPAAGVALSDLELLREKEEIELIRKLWQFSFILYVCYSTTDPYMLTVYLQELAEAFHRFYDRHRVLNPDDPVLTRARLLLITGCQAVLARGLELCGVSHPEKM